MTFAGHIHAHSVQTCLFFSSMALTQMGLHATTYIDELKTSCYFRSKVSKQRVNTSHFTSHCVFMFCEKYMYCPMTWELEKRLALPTTDMVIIG